MKIVKKSFNFSLRLIITFAIILIIKVKNNKFSTGDKSGVKLLTSTNIQDKFASQIKNHNKYKIKLENESSLTNKSCDHLCSQCSVNDSSYCTICQPGMIFYNFACYVSCPSGTFLDPETRICKECSSECPICWGSEKDMCGNNFGNKAKVVNLQDEIIEYFQTHIFIKDEVDQWLNSLKVIFKNDQQEIIYPMFVEKNPSFAVYMQENNYADLPIGSFSSANGIFIPIPPYLNKDKKLIKSHWVFKKGMWDGKNWNEECFRRLPSFIVYKGSTDKIYQENNGYWAYDVARHWTYIPAKNNDLEDINVSEKLSKLNQIKIDVV